MRIAYFDCFSGAAGDMIVAALIDAGCPLGFLQDAVAGLKLPGVALSTEQVRRGSIAATRVRVDVLPEAQTKHRHLPDIVQRIEAAGLPAAVAQRAVQVFRRLAEAEAAVHGISEDKVHFHEVGAADAMVDVVAACAGLAQLGVQRVHCSPIPTGTGTVHCAHGELPVPAPATALLLRGVPLAACDEPAELTTPTGAAVLTTFAESYGVLPAMRLERIGHGAGTREGGRRPNFLRVLIGDAETPADTAEDVIVVLEAQVDDATGQTLAHAAERLLAGGALDAHIVPIIMKKGRPGQILTVLCRPPDADRLEAVLFGETTTFGVRRHECRRRELARGHETVATAYGPIRVKVGRLAGTLVQAWPEYEDCAAAAREHETALRTVQQEALRVWKLGDDAR
ncbi:MAG: nickel pincer cofactor biosynthesis protein LarC [Phycisphaerae bacterium]